MHKVRNSRGDNSEKGAKWGVGGREQRSDRQVQEYGTVLYLHFPHPQAPAAHPQSAHEQPSVPQPGILKVTWGVIWGLEGVLMCGGVDDGG